ncbi:MAG: hypothetical protein LBT55_05535 [Clostridiaceae bacterium]|jgi:hypothetical protein|nr:hypothetical protein [Clostridiaceae bacterium]
METNNFKFNNHVKNFLQGSVKNGLFSVVLEKVENTTIMGALAEIVFEYNMEKSLTKVVSYVIHAPSVIASTLTEAEATELAHKIEAVGGKATVVKSTFKSET